MLLEDLRGIVKMQNLPTQTLVHCLTICTARVQDKESIFSHLVHHTSNHLLNSITDTGEQYNFLFIV